MISLLVRVGVAGSVLLVGLVVLGRAAGAGSPAAGYAIGLFGCAIIITGAIILAFPIARLLAEPVGSLFYPGKRLSRPVPMYSIPQSKRKSGLYEEAMSGFEQIAADYPTEVQPYIEMIDIAVMDLKDPDRANEIYRRGVSVLKKQQDRESLATMYSAIRSRLDVS